jgi:uncharacterized protein (TIGR03083 family)
VTSVDYAAAHQDAFGRLEGLLRGLDPGQLEAAVPACPEWSVLDVARHLTGLAVDCCGETLPGPEDWSEEVMDRRHVDARRSMSLEEILDEWRQAGPGFEKTLGRVDPRMAGALVGEYACHEHDIRSAIRLPGARSSLCTTVATDSYITAMIARVETTDLPALQVNAGDRRWAPPAVQADNEVSGDAFEVFRAVTGRRTSEQIAALDWRGPADLYQPVFSAFGIPIRPLDD